MLAKNISEWILRIAVFGTFLGHGILAIGVKESWFELFEPFGISEELARELLPIIGVMDIAIAFTVLIIPIRLVLIWATAWAFATALARPLAGEPIWDFVERTANWAAPLALLMIKGLPSKAIELVSAKEKR